MWGRFPIGSNGSCSALCPFSVTPSTTHNQIGPLWCCFPSGWACACSRPLWVSPTTSPVRRESSPPRLPVSTPPIGLDECLFFISLVVGLLYSSIFCQFWLVFVFKLLSFWLCEEAQCVYLRLHLGRKSSFSFIYCVSKQIPDIALFVVLLRVCGIF